MEPESGAALTIKCSRVRRAHSVPVTYVVLDEARHSRIGATPASAGCIGVVALHDLSAQYLARVYASAWQRSETAHRRSSTAYLSRIYSAAFFASRRCLKETDLHTFYPAGLRERSFNEVFGPWHQGSFRRVRRLCGEKMGSDGFVDLYA